MKKRLLALICALFSVICLCSCSGNSDVIPDIKPSTKSSTFSIQFIDVEQGDSALVECDGHYMLIDAGDKLHGSNVYSVLQEKQIQHLDILAISHLHDDHIGGLIKALTYASQIDLTLSNSDYRDTQTFRDVEHQLGINGQRLQFRTQAKNINLEVLRLRLLIVNLLQITIHLLCLYHMEKHAFYSLVILNMMLKKE